MTRARPIFLRARLVLVAELDALNVTSDNALPKWMDQTLRALYRHGGPLQFLADAVRVGGSGEREIDKDSHGDGGGEGGGKVVLANDWVGRVLHMEHTTEDIVEEKVGAALSTMMDAMANQEARLLEVERRLARKMNQAEKQMKIALRKEEVDDRHTKFVAQSKKNDEERATNRRFEDLARAQKESEQRLLQAIKAAK